MSLIFQGCRKYANCREGGELTDGAQLKKAGFGLEGMLKSSVAQFGNVLGCYDETYFYFLGETIFAQIRLLQSINFTVVF
jgi:hypothetical protein